MATRNAVVAGAGLGGLVAAVALHRRGWQVRVVERAASLEPVGAGISLWPNALRALDVIGVGDDVRGFAALSGPSGIRRPDGRWLARSDVGSAVRARFGDPLVVLHRAELAELLAARLPDGTISTSTTVTGARPGSAGEPAVLVTDRGELAADLLVGADGIRSVLRGRLFPGHPGPRYAGYTAWRAVVTTPDPVESGFETWGRGGRRFAVVPMGGNRCYCYATAGAPPGERSDDELARLTALFGDWHAPIPTVLAALAPGQVLHNDIEALPEPPPAFHRGRTALVGDAVHAMTPDLGQGGCAAIEDAVTLAAVVDRADDLPDALARYTGLRRPRTAELLRRSSRAGRIYQSPYLVQEVAARVMGLVPGATIARGLTPVVDWRPLPLG